MKQGFKMHKTKLKKYRNNANKLIDKLTDDEYDAAVDWYQEAHDFACELEITTGVKLDIVCQVIAILSPAVSWELNKKDAHNLLQCYESNLANKLKVSTYGANKDKALSVANELLTLQPTAMKTYAFYTNILTAGQNDNVTVDRHAYKALHNIAKGGSVRPSKKEYEELEEAYQILAKEHNLTPPQFQAVAWIAYKKQHKR